ncbi:hypothetical protein C8Q80DRAFT_1209746 [Daedaleopsis nitida]|nr:hypothetical protein C8Q80DRAFT_1209746 [Daedaleopsis nitida]
MAIHMEVQNFISTFLPNATKPAAGKSALKKPPLMSAKIAGKILTAAAAHDEAAISVIWRDWMNTKKGRDGSLPCPGFKLGLSQDKWDPQDSKKHKVDGAIYDEARLPDDGRPHWVDQEILCEFKNGKRIWDAFCDKTHAEAESKTRTDVRGQVTDYVGYAFSKQHRTTIFLFIINGAEMRITRWDRSGTIFTNTFNYATGEGRAILRDVLWGFSLLKSNPALRGLDTSAVPVGLEDPDYDLMTAVSQPCPTDISEVEGTVVEGAGPYTFRYVRQSFADSIEGDTQRHRLTVPTEDGRDRQFLVGKPLIVAPGVTGRGTRGFVAWDVKDEHFVFLKDAWRPFYEDIHTEGMTLRKLKKHDVRNIPTYVCDGELDQHTLTPEYAQKAAADKAKAEPEAAAAKGQPKPKGRKRPRDDAKVPSQSPFPNPGKYVMRRFRHYRLVVEEVCLSLTEFKTGEQLLSLVRDCIHAHQDAVTKGHVYHRDISAGNVLICPTVVLCSDGKRRVVWKGILTDWEMSKVIEDPAAKPSARQPKRTATWQFTAVRLLDNPSAPVMNADEMESFFYIVLYNALRYLRHTCINVMWAMYDLFDSFDRNGNEYKCGVGRRMTIKVGYLPEVYGSFYRFLDDELQTHPIGLFIGTVLVWTKARYAQLDAAAASTDLMKQCTGNIKDIQALVAAKKLAKSTQRKAELPAQTPLSAVPEKAKLLDTHDAILELIESLLCDDWPRNDKLGDQLKHPELAYAKQTMLDLSLLPQADEADGENEGRPHPKRRRSRKTQKLPAVEEEEDAADLVLMHVVVEEEPKIPPPTRTRGGRLSRPFGSSRRRT